MSNQKPKTADYIVTKQGVADKKIGDTVKLTERQAIALRNKVVAKADYNAAPKSSDTQGFEKDIKNLEKQVETLTAEKAQLIEKVENLENEKAAMEAAMGGGE